MNPETDTAREFQDRRQRFIRIASIWTIVLAVSLALGALLYLTAGVLREPHPTAYWIGAVALAVIFGGAALRIHWAHEKLFLCPRCAKKPQANELGVVLFLGWRPAGMDPATCAVCGAKLK